MTCDATGKVLGERLFEHSGAGLSEMADWLLSFAQGKAAEVGVAIKTPRGPVVESLMERSFAVHSINPKQLDRFRNHLSPAGAKDDRRDARVLASALRSDPHCLRLLESTDPTIVELRESSRLSEDLTRERVRLANRMRDQLWHYYPQFLDAVDSDVAAPWALDRWRSLPTPRAGQRVRQVTLTRVLKQHRIRRIDAATLRERLPAPAFKLAPSATEAATAHVRLVAERLALVNRQLDHARQELDRLVHQLVEAAPADCPDGAAEEDPDSSTQQPDAAILLSMPVADDEDRTRQLARALDRHTAPCLLVLDEVDRLPRETVELVQRLVEHGPGNLHFALAFRSNPGLDLAMQVFDGSGVVVGASEFRFSRAEIARFFAARNLSRRQLDAVEEQTAGWPVALTIQRNREGRGCGATSAGDCKTHHRLRPDAPAERCEPSGPDARLRAGGLRLDRPYVPPDEI